MKINGFEIIDYTSKDGRRVKGINIHRAIPCNNGKGFYTSKLFVSDEVLKICNVSYKDIEDCFETGNNIIIETVPGYNNTQRVVQVFLT